VPCDPAAFVQAHVHAHPVALVPELVLHQADDPIGLWELGEGEYHSEQPPPFWAFAWAGGQALARFVLDHPDLVDGRRVLDLASGSGLVAIAAARAGAAQVYAVDIDPLAVAAIELNAAANAVSVRAELADLLDDDADADVVLAGDVFYSAAMAVRMLGFLRRAVRNGARAFVGDPDRAFLPHGQLLLLTTMDVPVPHALESTHVKATSIWEVPPCVSAQTPERVGAQTPERVSAQTPERVSAGPTGPDAAAGATPVDRWQAPAAQSPTRRRSSPADQLAR
jgi:predicted nicotinamide N-methyase